jgi:hypothetical protein
MNCKTCGHILDGQDDPLLIDCGGDHCGSVGATEAEAGDDKPQGGPTGCGAQEICRTRPDSAGRLQRARCIEGDG